MVSVFRLFHCCVPSISSKLRTCLFEMERRETDCSLDHALHVLDDISNKLKKSQPPDLVAEHNRVTNALIAIHSGHRRWSTETNQRERQPHLRQTRSCDSQRQRDGVQISSYWGTWRHWVSNIVNRYWMKNRNMKTIALVTTRAELNYLCYPHFDSQRFFFLFPFALKYPKHFLLTFGCWQRRTLEDWTNKWSRHQVLSLSCWYLLN